MGGIVCRAGIYLTPAAEEPVDRGFTSPRSAGRYRDAMNLLLLSNSSSERGYLVDALAQIAPFARGATEAAFVPYAAVTRSYDGLRVTRRRGARAVRA